MEPILFAESIDVAGLLVRATILLGAGVGLTLMLKKVAAQARHLLWSIVFVALLVLPLGMHWMPEWQVPILPASQQPVHLQQDSRNPGDALAAESVKAEPGPLEIQPSGTNSGLVVQEAPLLEQSTRFLSDPVWILFGLWLAGLVAAILSLLAGTFQIWQLTRESEAVLDPDWTDQLSDIKSRLGITRKVRLRMAKSIATPMTSGSLRPIILIPDQAITWDRDRIKMVLTHELIHVHRYDALRHFLSRLTLGIYWFHPLSWMAARMADICREQACDAEVLALGTRPSSYANELLTLSGSILKEPSYAVLPMIRKSQLEKRLMAILDPNHPKKNTITSAAIVLLASVLGLLTVIARPVSAIVPASSYVAGLPLETMQETKERPDAVAAPETPQAVPAPMPVPVPPEPVPQPEKVKPAGPVKMPPPKKETTGSHMQLHANQRCEVSSTGAHGEKFEFRGVFSTKTSNGNTRYEYAGKQKSDRVVQFYAEGMRLCMRLHGDVEPTKSGGMAINVDKNNDKDVQNWAVIEAEGPKLYKMVLSSGKGGVEQSWSVDGEMMQADERAWEWVAQVVSILELYEESNQVQSQMANYKMEIEAYKADLIREKHMLESKGSKAISAEDEKQLQKLQMSVVEMQAKLAELEIKSQDMENEKAIERQVNQLKKLMKSM